MINEKFLPDTNLQDNIIEIRIFIDSLYRDFISKAGHFEIANILKEAGEKTWEELR